MNRKVQKQKLPGLSSTTHTQTRWHHKTFIGHRNLTRIETTAEGTVNVSFFKDVTITPYNVFLKMINLNTIDHIAHYTNNPNLPVSDNDMNLQDHIAAWAVPSKKGDVKYIHVQSANCNSVRVNGDEIETKQHEFNRQEILMYIAALIAGGISGTKSIGKLFENDPVGVFGNNWFKKNWTFDSFSYIHRRVRGNIAWMEHTFNNTFKAAWIPGHTQTIDEHIIPFKGRFAARCYIPTKPKTTGIKAFIMSDAARYIYNFWIYRVCYLLF